MNPAAIRALPPAERIALLEQLAVSRYGDSWKAPLADEFEVERTTVMRWQQRGDAPLPVLYAMSAWHDAGESYRDEIAELAQQLAGATDALRRLARRVVRA